MGNRVANTSHQDKLQRLAAEAEALRHQLRRSQRMASIGTMAAMIAHEFNNILTPIISYAALARTNPALTGKAIDKASKGGERARSICQAILRLAKGEAGELETVNLRALVDETMEVMGRPVEKDGILLTVDIPAHLAIATRAVELQQVLLNLIINARRAVLAHGAPRVLDIVAVEADGTCTIHVRDNGTGIAPENITKIFDPFFSTARKGDNDGGFGLGLTICREIIEAQGGTISVQSELKLGTTFTISLPSAVSRPLADAA
ncbi:MAG: sensor histidine kinase [Planctomycetota bacterium]|jgi:signal transduction histidine kinase